MDNELSYLASRGTFASELVVLVLNGSDLTKPRATLSEVSDELLQRKPKSALGEVFSRFIRPRLIHAASRTYDLSGSTADLESQERQNLLDLDRFDKVVSTNHARLVLLFAPFRRDVSISGGVPESVFHAWSYSRNVPMIDLTAIESRYTANEISLDGGIHFNARGHAIIARAMEEAWLQWGTVK